MINYGEPVDIYCERLDPSFWSEPLNALTNFAFILAAIFALSLWRDKGPKKLDIKILIVLTAIVGVGSFIFHTIATKPAILADVIPIVLFLHFAVAVIAVRVFKQKWSIGALAAIGFLIINIVNIKLFGRTLLNGSIQYVPALLVLLIVALYSVSKNLPFKKEFLTAAVLFFFSITFRSMDQMVCQNIPLGTHFLWHVLNSMVMYYSMKALIIAEAKKTTF